MNGARQGAAAGLALLSLLTVGCRTAAPPRPDAQLVVQVAGPAPLLLVDDHVVRTFPRGPAGQEHHSQIDIPAGTHRIEARAEGCFPAYQDATVLSRGRRTVRLVLRPDPDADGAPPPAAGAR